MSLVCININKNISCRVAFFSDVFSTCLVAWTSFTPLDKFAGRLKKKLHDRKILFLHLCKLERGGGPLPTNFKK